MKVPKRKIRKNLGAVLKQYRTQSNYSIGQAEQLLSSSKNIREIEMGNEGITGSDFCHLLNTYGVSRQTVAELLYKIQAGN
jgi:hypothetical protein